jgi:hypothetical protein
MALRVYTKERLTNRSKEELQSLLDGVKTNRHLTPEEIEANVVAITEAINGGIKRPNIKILEEIKAGAADISDMGGF